MRFQSPGTPTLEVNPFCRIVTVIINSDSVVKDHRVTMIELKFLEWVLPRGVL